MNYFEQIARMAGTLFNAEVDAANGQCEIKKTRALDICVGNSMKFSCTLDLDISFSALQEDGIAFNKAEIFLLPGEFTAFTSRMIEYPVPLPTQYHQRMVTNPQIVCLYIEAFEAPEDFMGRIAAALKGLEEAKDQLTAAI
ncbi:MAG TPA: hypothetical protein VK947_00310 [Planococcus sp. (in: firmicutes)]|nr:hypothetical protein [Planococcus sp. (in: firmicutes)]